MKKNYILAACMSAIALGVTAQNANVSLSNLSSNNGFTGYDAGTKVISGIYFEILSDGDDSDNILDDFQTSIYLLECDASGSPTSNTPIVVKTYDISGMQQLHAIDYSNESVDLTQVSGLNEGMYRVGVWVNSDEGIPNPPDDPGDNAGLIKHESGNMSSSIINYSDAVGLSAVAKNQKSLSVYPNPANNWLNIRAAKGAKIEVYDLLGNSVLETIGQTKINIGRLPAGVYYVKVGDATQKFVKVN